ncbi:MAG: hypothetical protein KIT63_24065 [Rhodoferax sp.]|nr:hypothetical protein [Rhodoferax sp.]
MKRKGIVAERNSKPSKQADEARNPLLRVLVVQAQRRGDTLQELAKKLGVTYARLAQWRRQESDFAGASAQVIESAGEYLGIPGVLAMVMAGRIGLAQLAWPAPSSFDERMQSELRRLRDDPYLGGFVPTELDSVPPSVQLFVVFLFHELTASGRDDESHRWVRELHRAATGDQQALAQLGHLREARSKRKTLF